MTATTTGHALAGLFTTKVGDFARAVAWSTEGNLLAVGDASGEVTLFDGGGGVASRFAAHAGGVLALWWAKDRLATSGHDGSAKLWSPRGEPIAVLPGTGAAPSSRAPWVEHVAFAPGGAVLATAAARTVRLWTADGEAMLETEPHPSTVTGLAWSRRGTELATIAYGGVHLFSLSKKKRVRHFSWKGSLIAIAWSPNDAVIACASQDCSVHFWRLATGQDSEMTGYPFKPRAIAWDARGTMLATSGDAQITLWRFEGKGPEGTRPTVLEAHRAQVTSLAWNPRKALLASASQDTGIIVWQPRKNTAPLAYAFGEDRIVALAWHPEGTHLAAIDESGRVTVWASPDVARD